MRNAQAGIKIARRNTSNLRYAGDTTLMAESEEELKSLLIKVKEESDQGLWIQFWNLWLLQGRVANSKICFV